MKIICQQAGAAGKKTSYSASKTFKPSKAKVCLLCLLPPCKQVSRREYTAQLIFLNNFQHHPSISSACRFQIFYLTFSLMSSSYVF